jgi:putative phosphoserine phosphatase/1-acylglycerol-3-phosphate O-acyltransferase
MMAVGSPAGLHRLTATTRAARFAVGLAGLGPAATVGVAAGLIRGSKRDGIDAALPRWLDWYLAAAGVTVDVVEGSEHLRAPRPAVFIFNHKNYWDALCLMSVVRTGFTGVGKKEIQDNPVLGAAGRLLDIALVDRSGALSAKEQLAEVEERARSGLSILIAPEGTRSPDGNLGPFKKGPFRIAMAAGLPIIPLVFRNAEVLGDRRSKIMGSGRVETVVLDPVDPTNWDLDELPTRIDDIRQAFLDVLGR